jgi:hypothetical protein
MLDISPVANSMSNLRNDDRVVARGSRRFSERRASQCWRNGIIPARGDRHALVVGEWNFQKVVSLEAYRTRATHFDHSNRSDNYRRVFDSN